VKIKNRLLQKEELEMSRGQKKVELHEEWCGRKYAENNER